MAGQDTERNAKRSLWEIVKFLLVSCIVSIIQLVLVNALYFGLQGWTAPLPDVGEWNRFGASIEVNGEKIAPPKWKRPGLKKGMPLPGWSTAWVLPLQCDYLIRVKSECHHTGRCSVLLCQERH